MQRVLGKKQSIANSDWERAAERIEDLVSMEELDELTKAAVGHIRGTVGHKRAAVAWSGGKDSLVLEHICRQAGIEESIMGVCNLEYPEFTAWVYENAPAGLTVINTGQDLDWLAAHPQMLFPQSSKEAAQWFHIVQHRAQARYYRENDLEVLILGRRRADGNYCGKGTNIYTDGKGVTRYSPLADWPHEAVLAYIHYHDIPMPPIYGWHNGYLCGTHPWPARQWTGSVENGWKEVYEISPIVVKTAAEKVESARLFLDSLN